MSQRPDHKLPSSIANHLRELIFELDNKINEIQQKQHCGSVTPAVAGFWDQSVDDPRILISLLPQFEWELTRKPEFALFSEALASESLTKDQINQNAGLRGVPRFTIDGRHILRVIIAKRLGEVSQGRSIPVTEFVERACEQLCHDFTKDTIRVRFCVVLENVLLESGPIELEQGVKIRRDEGGLVENLWERYRTPRQSLDEFRARMMALRKSQAYATTEIDIPKVPGGRDSESTSDTTTQTGQEPREDFSPMLAALRLISDEPVYLGASWTESDSLIYIGVKEFRGSTARAVHLGSYIITDERASSLSNLYPKVAKAMKQKNRPAALAIRRFSLACERAFDQDALIDAMIALEALLLSEIGKGDNRGELRHRLSVRAAHLLGGSPEDMKANYTQFKKLYDLRSTVVHGSAIKPAGIAIARNCVQLARQIAVKYLEFYLDKAPPWDDWLFGDGVDA